ncbi:MAG TPA: hypothetical protein IGS53_11600 [Leptolyngbyaceae cyanobacterium M33_DOE_097]|uniref:Uncharacterized protein n=1 Tax=Oscillatoriales cyanobacterium SpSt-418 TaxID=2282169 RepID=A0A7C3KHF6_9CYAN|nr:hypothetical protein [Leptolyngbyaceae cyanobacterium M33_DOE_097]
MNLPIDEAYSVELAQQIKSKAKNPFDNAYQAALVIQGATYVQGFVVLAGQMPQLIEHAWLEVGDRLVDPTFPHFNRLADQLFYFEAQRLSVKKLKAAVEEAQEDYPDDPPLPIYGSQPYEYYGDLMLGGKEYQAAFEAAEVKQQELGQASQSELN